MTRTLLTVFAALSCCGVYAAQYETPICPVYGNGCFHISPEQPNSNVQTYVYFEFYSGLDYYYSKVSPLTVAVDGNSIHATGTVTLCTDCASSLPPPAREVAVVVPPVPAGAYNIDLQLIYDPSYTDHPLVETDHGLVYASGLVMSGQMTVVQGAQSEQETVVEYYDVVTNHYFITPLANEIALLDARQPPFADWGRTGFAFNAYVSATAPEGAHHVCRFYNDSLGNGEGTHFYAAYGLGCEQMFSGNFPDWQLESNALFDMAIPSVEGSCSTGTIPVYRLYNNGQAGVPNHRFVTDLSERQKMIDRGWIPEGFGVGVTMCAPD